MEFGTATRSFNHSKLNEYINNEDICKAKQYICRYFAKVQNPIGVIVWEPADESQRHYTDIEIKSRFLMKRGKEALFDPQTWFFSHQTPQYIRQMRPNKELVYKYKGASFINLFHGYPHTIRPNKIKYMTEIKFIWGHVFDQLCSRNKPVFDYLQNWICHAVSGRKMKTGIYFKSGQGTGKSIFTEFLTNKVLSRHITFTTSESKSILGNFNIQLMGKVLLVLEEMPADTVGQWNTLSNALKHLITSDTMTIEEKQKNQFMVDNTLSIILSTNNNAIKLEIDDRRFLVADVSHSKVGNVKYFDELGSYTENDEVGEAFYWFCKKHAEENINFKEQVMPKTQAKIDQIIDNLPALYQFIKSCYVLRKRPINKKFSVFMTEFINYCIKQGKGGKNCSKINASKMLKSIGIDVIQKGGNISWVVIESDKLYDIYSKKNWLHSTDDYDDVDEIENLEDDFDRPDENPEHDTLDMEIITTLHDEAMDNFKVVLNLEPPERGIIHDAEKDADNIISILGQLEE